MAFTSLLASAARAAGSYAVPVTAVAPGMSRLTVRLMVSSYTQAARACSVQLEASMDNQATWVPFGAAAFAGGTVLAKDSVSAGVRQVENKLDPTPGRYPTHVRGTLAVAGGSVTCGVSVETA